ncbi:CCR4-NOT transcription complex subunit 3-like [Heterodontus francisci]|uniref:CCR4-NOT transcription complex subunit 3-like n=1 Tax=Heterodontus francisci TaxID=7792 RepID=UPI00355C10A8
MEPFCWRLFLCISLASWVPVFSQRHSGNTAMNCCKLMLLEPLPGNQFHHLKSYTHLPSHGLCPEYLEFTSYRGISFCILLSKAKEMKAFIDSRSDGPSKDFQTGPKEPTEGKKGMLPPTPSPQAPTIPPWQTGPPTSSNSSTAQPGLEGQERNATLQTMPPSPPQVPTIPPGQTGPPTSSNSSTAQPGLEGQERNSTLQTMPPSPPQVPTSPPGQTGPPTSSNSSTAQSGLEGQERNSTLQSTARPASPAQLQHEDVTTKDSTGDTYRTSLHPRNIVAATETSPPNETTEENRSAGLASSPSSAMSSCGDLRMSDGGEPGPGDAPCSRVSDKHHGYSGERGLDSGSHRLHYSLLSAVVLFTTFSVLMWVMLKPRPFGLTTRERRCSVEPQARVTLVHYCRISNTYNETV